MHPIRSAHAWRAAAGLAVACGLVAGAAGCGGTDTVRVADGAPPPAGPEADDPTSEPSDRTGPVVPGAAEDRGLDCTGEFTSAGIYDYVFKIGPDGREVQPNNPNTPDSIAKRWAREESAHNPDWDPGSPPAATFTYDRQPARKAREVRVDFATPGGAVIASLVADRQRDGGWLLRSMESCTLGPPPSLIDDDSTPPSTPGPR